MNRLKSFLIKYLNCKYRRGILSVIFSIISSLKNIGLYLIYYDSRANYWIHKRGKDFLLIEDIPNFSVSYSRIEKTTLTNWLKHYTPNHNDNIIDLGAGVGNDIFIMKKHYNSINNIYAIEAHPKTFDKLEYLVKQNQFENIKCCNIAITNQNMNLFISDTVNHSANRINKKSSGLKIQGITMDCFVEKNEIKKIDYIKINIEGAEKEALLGMKRTLDITSNIVIACHDKLAKYYDNDPFFVTAGFVRNSLQENKFRIIEEVESTYHITIFANKG